MGFDRLFEQFTIKKLRLKNRLVMAPMTTISGNADGSFSDEEVNYLGQRAAAGIGLIMTPACYCHKSGHSFERQVGCHNEDMIAGLTRCADVINRHGAASFLQIHHGGNAAKQVYAGRPPMAPSAVHNRRGTSELPQAMSEDEIWMIVESFARAAGRAQRAGFSGVELHGANTYLFQQFFSPFTNKRSDKWGIGADKQSSDRLTHGTRFACEVVKAVRAEVGNDYPISYRISPEEPEPQGYTTAETIELLNVLIPLGVDVVHVSSSAYGVSIRHDSPSALNPTKSIRDAMPSQVTVIGVGGIILPDAALKVLDDGIDLVAMGKILLLDKDWGVKVKSGRVGEIRTGIRSEEERFQLDIPRPMVAYTHRFFSPEN